MDFVLYILPFGLVRLRTFRLEHGLGATLTQVFTRAQRGCLIQRCHNKKSQIGIGQGYLGDVTHRKRGMRFEKKQLVEFPPRKKKVDLQSWARPDDFVRYERRVLVGLRADDVKAGNIERLCLSPHVEKNL